MIFWVKRVHFDLDFIVISRYYAILYPMRAKYVCTVGRARRAILILWILSFILAIPILIGQVRILIGGEATVLLLFLFYFFLSL